MGQGALATLIGLIVMATSSALATTTAPGAAPGATSGAAGGGIGDYWWAIGPPRDRCRDLVLHEGPTSGLSRAPECPRARGS